MYSIQHNVVNNDSNYVEIQYYISYFPMFKAEFCMHFVDGDGIKLGKVMSKKKKGKKKDLKKSFKKMRGESFHASILQVDECSN